MCEEVINKERFQKAAQITDCLVLSDEQLMEVKSRMLKEFEKGLRDEKHAIIKMLITYVRDIPTGKEIGSYLALDLGGTHFRVLLVNLNGEKTTIIGEKYKIPKNIMTAHGSKLFAYIADCIYDFIEKKKIRQKRIALGFTFSFPCYQYGLTTCKLVRWTKGFDCPGVEGEDACRLLREAIYEKHSQTETFIDVVAIINDTTGTLVSCAHTNKDCCVALIVGTGCNACYMEKLENIEKWTGNYTEPKQVIINTEWGAFGEQNGLDFIESEWDKILDKKSINPGKQLFEKKLSGMYLGEIARLVLKTICEQKLIFNGNLPLILSGSEEFKTKYVSLIDSIDDGESLLRTMKDIFSDVDVDKTDMQIIRMVTSRVSTRAAYLTACGCSAILEKMKRKFCVIGYDGAVICKHPKFKSIMTKKIEELTDKNWKFELMKSEDGSGVGAALVAAVTYREKRPCIIKRGRKVYELCTLKDVTKSG
ncbi:hexokinase-1-like protein [Dinothrombium tinctorium]|uniref:Phosphotransferase n=1 Tax=Dinothrombium tinctorium TaxID=1965070 RepID=A0A443R992_9ACAR|nr:hexokinase-1-like protein [Dinothrombium tinctorium]RWS11830.1 hexokinase-1-like protein [Dinothrombium tinctorium]